MFMLWLLFLVSCVCADEPGVILTRGEHFDDIVLGSDGVVSKNTILILYHTRCPPQIDFYDLPAPQHLYYFTYGVDNTLQYTWFSLQDNDDLYQRYGQGSGECQQILFFKKDSDDNRPQRWSADSGMDQLEWIWSLIKVNVNVHNSMKTPVVVQPDNNGLGPLVSAGSLKAGESVTLSGYPGHSISVREEDQQGQVLLNMVLGAEQNQVVRIMKRAKPSPSMEEVMAEEESRNEWWTSYQVSTACRHLANMKAPLLIPSLSTDQLYKVEVIPAKVHQILHAAFVENYNKHTREDVLRSNAPFVYRPADSKSNIVPVPESSIHPVAKQLKPLVEEFCGRKLKFTGFDGIRESYAGERVFPHVTDIGTQVISVLLLLEDDLARDPWEIDFINNNQRWSLTLNQGEMLIYESAKLIVGRSKPFHGYTSSEIVLYFAPEEWGYARDEMHYVNLQTGFFEHIGTIITELTTLKREPTQHDEL